MSWLGRYPRLAPIPVRHAPDVLHQIGWHLAGVADPVAAQGQRVDEPAEALFDRADDLVVASDRGEEMRDIVGRLRR